MDYQRGHMDANNLSLVWGVLTAIGTVAGAAFMFLWNALKDVQAHKAKDHDDLWKAVNAIRDGLGIHKEDCLVRYATKEDFKAIRDEIDRRFDKVEEMITRAFERLEERMQRGCA